MRTLDRCVVCFAIVVFGSVLGMLVYSLEKNVFGIVYSSFVLFVVLLIARELLAVLWPKKKGIAKATPEPA